MNNLITKTKIPLSISTNDDFKKQMAWMRICNKLAKSTLQAYKEFHKNILGHRTWVAIRKFNYTCKNCGFSISKKPYEIHAAITGQSIEESILWFDKLQDEFDKRKISRKEALEILNKSSVASNDDAGEQSDAG